MNSQLAIIVAVDVDAAIAQNMLDSNFYLVDNNRFNGSTGQGSDKLVTVINGQQIVNWLILPTDIYNGSIVYILDVQGEAVEKGIMVPQVFESPEFSSRGLWWGANVGAGDEGMYSYELVLSVNGQKMILKSRIFAKRAFSNYDVSKSKPSKEYLPDSSEMKMIHKPRAIDL